LDQELAILEREYEAKLEREGRRFRQRTEHLRLALQQVAWHKVIELGLAIEVGGAATAAFLPPVCTSGRPGRVWGVLGKYVKAIGVILEFSCTGRLLGRGCAEAALPPHGVTVEGADRSGGTACQGSSEPTHGDTAPIRRATARKASGVASRPRSSCSTATALHRSDGAKSIGCLAAPAHPCGSRFGATTLCCRALPRSSVHRGFHCMAAGAACVRAKTAVATLSTAGPALPHARRATLRSQPSSARSVVLLCVWLNWSWVQGAPVPPKTTQNGIHMLLRDPAGLTAELPQGRMEDAGRGFRLPLSPDHLPASFLLRPLMSVFVSVHMRKGLRIKRMIDPHSTFPPPPPLKKREKEKERKGKRAKEKTQLASAGFRTALQSWQPPTNL